MKKKIIIALTLVLMAFGAYRGTLAIFHEETSVDAPISAGKLGIDIMNSSTNEITDHVSFANILPGARLDDQVCIRNTKDKDVYVRITLTRYWKDAKDKKITDANAAYIQPITKNTEDWIIKQDANANEEIVYFYYKGILPSKQATSNLIDEIAFDSDIDGQYRTYNANITFEAEAIQTMGASDAMLSQWGVEALFDDKGFLVEVTE